MDHVKANFFNVNNLMSKYVQDRLKDDCFFPVLLCACLPLHALFIKLCAVKHLSSWSNALPTVEFVLLHSAFPAEIPLNHCHLVTAHYHPILPLSPNATLLWINENHRMRRDCS